MKVEPAGEEAVDVGLVSLSDETEPEIGALEAMEAAEREEDCGVAG